MKKTDNYLDEAIKNIRKDREITKDLLNDLIIYLSKDEARHTEVGTVAAKYVETLQRSNEQLVKIVTLLEKKKSTSAGLTDDDKSEIFDLLNGENQCRTINKIDPCQEDLADCFIALSIALLQPHLGTQEI